MRIVRHSGWPLSGGRNGAWRRAGQPLLDTETAATIVDHRPRPISRSSGTLALRPAAEYAIDEKDAFEAILAFGSESGARRILRQRWWNGEGRDFGKSSRRQQSPLRLAPREPASRESLHSGIPRLPLNGIPRDEAGLPGRLAERALEGIAAERGVRARYSERGDTRLRACRCCLQSDDHRVGAAGQHVGEASTPRQPPRGRAAPRTTSTASPNASGASSPLWRASPATGTS